MVNNKYASAFSEEIKSLAEGGERRRYRKGSILINEGDPGDSLYVILTGRVKVFSVDPDDHEITYGVLGPAEFFGEMSLDGGPRSASVVTLEPVECAVLSQARVHEHLRSNPEFAIVLLKTVIHRAREATRVARGLALDSAYRRLAEFLERNAEPVDGGIRVVRERITHQEIASRIGTSREMVSRLLKDLENGGYLQAEHHQFKLHKKLPDRW